MYVTEIFSAGTTNVMEADAVTIPLGAEATADLLKLLSDEDDYTYAAIASDATYETVKLTNVSNTLVVERGIEGTTAVKHPCGSVVCLVSPTTVAAIKALICEYDCCADEDCPCEGVAFAGSYLPPITVGEEWSGAVIVTGKAPVQFAIKDQPAWMNAVSEGNTLKLSGTPTSATGKFAVAATNCNGTQVVVETFSLA